LRKVAGESALAAMAAALRLAQHRSIFLALHWFEVMGQMPFGTKPASSRVADSGLILL